MTWIVAAMLLPFFSYNKFKYYAAWAGGALVFAAPNLLDYLKYGHLGSVAGINFNFLDLTKYYAIFVGSAFSGTGDIDLSYHAGIWLLFGWLLGIFFLIRKRDTVPAAMPWIVISCWVLINGVLAAVGRAPAAGIKLQGATHIRYAMYGVFFVVSVSGLFLAHIFLEKKTDFLRNKSLIVSIVFMASMVGLNVEVIRSQVERNYYFGSTRVYHAMPECVKNYRVAPRDCFSRIHPDPLLARSGVARLVYVGALDRAETDLSLEYVKGRSNIAF